MATIVMTGASSGIGLAAARVLAARGHRLLIGTCETMPQALGEARTLDLCDLYQVRDFAASLRDLAIDALVLNAGVQHDDVVGRTAEGFEQTFQVNHLAPYLLCRLLLRQMQSGGVIVFTSSAAHDPAQRSPFPPPRHADARRLAWPETDAELDSQPVMAGLRAYASSKLANVLTARTLARQPEAIARGLRVLAFDPGLTPGTGLVRSAPRVVRHFAWPLAALLQPLFRSINAVDAAGAALAGLADGALQGRVGEAYCSLRAGLVCWVQPSSHALDEAVGMRLWADSAELVGLD